MKANGNSSYFACEGLHFSDSLSSLSNCDFYVERAETQYRCKYRSGKGEDRYCNNPAAWSEVMILKKLEEL